MKQVKKEDKKEIKMQNTSHLYKFCQKSGALNAMRNAIEPNRYCSTLRCMFTWFYPYNESRATLT